MEERSDGWVLTLHKSELLISDNCAIVISWSLIVGVVSFSFIFEKM